MGVKGVENRVDNPATPLDTSAPSTKVEAERQTHRARVQELEQELAATKLQVTSIRGGKAHDSGR